MALLKPLLQSKQRHTEQIQRMQHENKRLSDNNHLLLHEKHEVERHRDQLESEKLNLQLQMVAQQKTINQLQTMQHHSENQNVGYVQDITRQSDLRSNSASDLKTAAELDHVTLNTPKRNVSRPTSTRSVVSQVSANELPLIDERASFNTESYPEMIDVEHFDGPVFAKKYSFESDDVFTLSDDDAAHTPVSYMRRKRTSGFYTPTGVFNKRMSFKSSIDSPISPLSRYGFHIDTDGVDVSDDSKDLEDTPPLEMEYRRYKTQMQELGARHQFEKQSLMRELSDLKNKLEEIENPSIAMQSPDTPDGTQLKITISHADSNRELSPRKTI